MQMTRLAVAGVAACAMLAIATPSRAADGDYKGWFAALDVAMTQPNSLDQHYANHVVTNAPVSTTERLVMENDSHTTWRGSVGYSFGKSLGSLRVSYWNFDNDDENTKNGLLGGVYPTIVGYGFSASPYLGYASNATYPIDVTATSSIKAKTVDIDYVRPMIAGEKLSVRWIAGLRVATYEEDQGFSGTITYGLGSYTYTQNKNFKSTAKGPKVGVAAVFEFTKHFQMVGGMSVSFLQADTKGTARAVDSGGNVDNLSVNDDYIRGEIRDYDLKAVWAGYGHLDYYLGYSASEWNGLVADPLPASMTGIGSVQSRGRDTIAFNSLHGGVIFRFGKK
ncbi:MAG TPA: Lpg1974 family pore-forming outer membrane protein [Candidatus Polarisedimenticolia bacterium]|nr:Lpg1974 family pore-forming outer membrane protein [Candidatus Polarisedimenticolia bacterium]